jgi:hypothetical protein
MRLSESIRRRILDAGAGVIINRFKIRKRRDTLFFEDILAEYFRVCEGRGYGDDMAEIGKEWMALFFKQLVPGSLRRYRLFLLNSVMSKIWANLGLIEQFSIDVKDDIATIVTKNEGVTRIIGKNMGMVGFYQGVINGVFERQAQPEKVMQSFERCEYVFRISEEKFDIDGKGKDHYNRLNLLPKAAGYDLAGAIEKGVFELKAGNRIFFRDKSICPIENTIFHIIGNKRIMMNFVPGISHAYFSKTMENPENAEKRLLLLKIILESMGWGTCKILKREGDGIHLSISNPPHGLQKSGDNWDFISMLILGFLWTIDRKYSLKSSSKTFKNFALEYAL